jgi:hypothetical protein
MFYADSSSSSSSSSNDLRYLDSSCVCDSSSRGTNPHDPGYFAYHLDSTATSNTSHSSSERINVSEMRRLKLGMVRDNGLVMDRRGNLYHGYRGSSPGVNVLNIALANSAV